MLKFKMLKMFMFALILGSVSGLVASAEAYFEITPHVGLHSKNAIYINGDAEESKTTLIFAGDAQYNFLLNKRTFYNSYLGLGLRYKHYLSELENSSDKVGGQRLTFLLSSRFLLKERFIVGFLYGLDLWKSLSIEQESDKFKGSEWIDFISQVGIEVGFKFTDFLLAKVELGISNLYINDLECRGCAKDNISARIAKPYILLGISWLIDFDDSLGNDEI